ncbi:TIGR02301 family protein [Rhizobium leguminosarum bv. trifolii]|uniref:TIGR02301 family protein n=2 Tax=Rhizobium leguminosarum TaxID=384 RepID=A0A3E1BTX0_RHILT|nr:TIGR02301 family protein [Rhizobium leguminosarum bv. trifolii]RFB97797.1 TIGR02301 family protein [Rhizobium leguminosarum bv. trifolii]
MIPVRRVFLSLLLLAGPTMAQGKSTPPPREEEFAPPPAMTVPYDDKLARLAEVLGSVHYLRTLCKAADGDGWRIGMQQLLDSETSNEPQRKEKLTAAFNRGYRAFASVYTDCTAAAIVAEERYRNEGATLATEITSRFGN